MSALRIRHPGKPAADIDLGPCPEVRGSLGGVIAATPIGSMSPVIVGTVHSAMSDGHGTSKVQQSFSIRPENRYRPDQRRCGITPERSTWACARLEGHRGEHRSPASVAAHTESRRVEDRYRWANCGRYMPLAADYCGRREGHKPRDINGKSTCRTRASVEMDLERKRQRKAA